MRRRRSAQRRAGSVVAAVALVALCVAPADATSRMALTAGVDVAASCPRAALALGSNPVAPASRAALAREPREGDAQVVGAAIAGRSGDLRAQQVIARCGRRLAARTVIVYLTRRAYLPAQSASQGVHFVSRFRVGWRVWEVAH